MHYRLTLTAGQHANSRPIFERECSGSGHILLGRGEDADVVLNDTAVSRVHCQISYESNVLVLMDLGSTSGTYRNGQQVSASTALGDGDALRLGATTLRVALQSCAGDSERGRVAQPLSAAADLDVRTDPSKTAMPGAGSGGRRPARDPEVLDTLIDPRRRHAPAMPNIAIRLERPVTIIGRGQDCDCQLANPTVSRRHAEITRRDERLIIRDLRSANGTFVNEQRLRGRAQLRAGDHVRFGSLDLAFDGRQLTSHAVQHAQQVGDAGINIELVGLGKQVVSRDDGRLTPLLADVSLKIAPQEFVGIFGTAGCGKSTLMDAMNGRRPATAGAVLYNGRNLYDHFDAFKGGIGYVPQELIFHDALTVADALTYAAEIRLPPDTSTEELEQNVDRVLRDVGLFERRGVAVRNLSGGQRKRVSIAIELLSRPNALFLDEATSGLDLRTEAEMMRIFRDVAASGVTTLCITHYADSLEACDKVIYLIQGRLAFYGTPAELKQHFGVDNIREVFWREPRHTAEEWAQRFEETRACSGRCLEAQTDNAALEQRRTKLRPGDLLRVVRSPEYATQFRVLLRRFTRVLLNDARALALLLGLAPILGVLVSYRFGSLPQGATEGARQMNITFAVVVGMFFLGLFGSIREVVKELRIYLHERFATLHILPYLGSKLAVLGVVNAVQVLVMYLFVRWGGPLDLAAGSELALLITMFLIAFSATALGLAASCAVDTTDKAVITMVVLIMPQILFTQALGPLEGTLALIGKALIPCYWGLDALRSLLDPQHFPTDPHSHGWFASIVALLVFTSIYSAAGVYFLHRKDGPYGRIDILPVVEEGRSALRRLLVRLQARWPAAKRITPQHRSH